MIFQLISHSWVQPGFKMTVFQYSSLLVVGAVFFLPWKIHPFQKVHSINIFWPLWGKQKLRLFPKEKKIREEILCQLHCWKWGHLKNSSNYKSGKVFPLCASFPGLSSAGVWGRRCWPSHLEHPKELECRFSSIGAPVTNGGEAKPVRFFCLLHPKSQDPPFWLEALCSL